MPTINKCILLILILFVCSLFSGCGGLIGLFEKCNTPLQTYEITGSASKIKIDVPCELKDEPLNNMNTFLDMIKGYKHKVGVSDTLAVKVLCCSVDTEKVEEMTGEPYRFDLEEAAEGALKDIKALPGSKNAKKESSEKIKINKINAMKVKISYTTNNKNKNTDIVADYIIFSKEEDSWIICTHYRKDDFVASSISEKIFKSIVIR